MARVSLVSRFGWSVVLAGASCAWGQSVISAQSGMVHYVEGKVLLEGQPVEPKFGDFPAVKNNEVLETAEGRAEVLLTPGVFLRLAENSSFKMLSNRLSDTAFEVLSGSAMVEVDELMKDNAITVRYKDATMALSKQGLYRVDADSGKLRVYDGEADVTYGIKTVQVHKGKQVELTETLLASTFDVKDTDAFYRWVSRRSEYIASANVSSARAAGNAPLNTSVPCAGQASTTANASFANAANPGTYCNPWGSPGGPPYPYGYNGYPGSFYGAGMWAWNPYYGMFTYMPGMGYGYSPFGWAIYSPVTVGSLYVPGNYRASATPVLTNRSVGPTALAGTRSAGTSSSNVASSSAIRANSAPASSGSSSSGGVSRGASATSSSGGSSLSSSGASASRGASSGGGGKR
jgi:hypothetical protein